MATHSSNSCLENSMNRGAWQATVHEVMKSQTLLSPHTHTNILMKLLGHYHPLYSLTLLLIRVSPYSQYNYPPLLN